MENEKITHDKDCSLAAEGDSVQTVVSHYFQNGVTVKELKMIIKDWPDKLVNGEDAEVWLKSGDGVSSPLTEIEPLNKRLAVNGDHLADIYLG